MASTDATPLPRKNTAYRVYLPIWDADGDLVTGAAGLDSEVSKDGGAFADCTNEATEIGSSGIYYLELTSTEMNADAVCIVVKTSSSGAKTTPIILYPQETGDVRVNVTAWNGTAVPSEHTAGYPIVTVKDGTGTGEIDTTSGGVLVAALANDAITAAAIAADAIGSSELAATAGSEIASAVRTELTTELGRIDAAISTRLASASYTAPLDAAGVRSAVGLASANLDTQLTTIAGYLDTEVAAILAAVDTEVAAIKAKTDNLPSDPADQSAVEAAITSATSALATAAALSTVATYIDTEVAAILAAVDTEVAAIKAKTDGLPADPATETTLATLATAANLATLTGYVDTEVAAIKAKTDNLPASPAAVGSAMTLTSGERDSVADAFLNRDMSTGTDSGSATVRTVRQALRFLRNKWSISGTTLTVFKEDDASTSHVATLTTDDTAEPVTGSDPASS